MQIMVDGVAVHHAPDLKGYKVDLTRPVMRLSADLKAPPRGRRPV